MSHDLVEKRPIKRILFWLSPDWVIVDRKLISDSGECPVSNTLSGLRVAFVVAPEGVEQVELTEPWKAVREAGGNPELISTKSGSIQAFNHLDKADTFPVDKVVGDASAADYAGLVLPGGVANPDYLRTVSEAVSFIG